MSLPAQALERQVNPRHPVDWKTRCISYGIRHPALPAGDLIHLRILGSIDVLTQVSTHAMAPQLVAVSGRYILQDTIGGEANGGDGVRQIEIELSNLHDAVDFTLTTGPKGYDVLQALGSWIAFGPGTGARTFAASAAQNGSKGLGTPIHTVLSVDEMLEAVHLFSQRTDLVGVLLSPQFADGRTGGLSTLEPYISAIRNKFQYRLVVDIDAPEDFRWIERAYAWGCDGLLVHLGGIEASAAQTILGRPRTEDEHGRALAALEFAATTFSAGSVGAILFGGRHPGALSLDGVENLISRQILPLIVPDRDLDREMLAQLQSDIAAIGLMLDEAPSRPPWLEGFGNMLTPGETRRVGSEGPRHSMALARLYESKLGNKALLHLANLRRRLRVNSVRDSFESSGL